MLRAVPEPRPQREQGWGVSESSLALSYANLLSEVGQFLGMGRGNENGESDSAWTQRDRDKLDSIVKSGLRNFYFPPPREGQSESYNWSFLRPVGSFVLESAASTVHLPDDFGSPEGRATIATDGSTLAVIDFTSEGRIREAYARDSDATGSPLLLSVRPIKGTSAGKGQRFELYVWPTADAAYTLSFQYYLNPDALTTARPHPYGGAVHSETILESCLAIAEQRLDDASSVHSMKFHERLTASISHDYKLKPQLHGYNGNREREAVNWRDYGRLRSTVTFEGSEYS